MRIYLVYLIGGFLIFWMVTFYLGFSMGFASYKPLIALLSAVTLFSIAAPIYVYFPRLGLIIGIICCTAIIPYGWMIVKGIIEDNVINSGLLLVTPIFVIMIGNFISIVEFFKKSNVFIVKSKIQKVLLFTLPILTVTIYFLLYARYWSISNFLGSPKNVMLSFQGYSYR